MKNGLKKTTTPGNSAFSKARSSKGLYSGLRGWSYNTKLLPLTRKFTDKYGIEDQNEIWATNNTEMQLRQCPTIFDSIKDCIYYPISQAGYGAAVGNLMNDNFTLTGGNAPLFSKTGLFFNGVDQFLKTGFVPSVMMKPNVGFTCAYIRNNVQSLVVMGAVGTSTQHWYVRARDVVDQARISAYSHATLYNVSNTNSSGVFVWGILANNYRYIMKDGVLLGVSTTTVGGTLPPYELYLGARHNGALPGADLFSNYEIPTVIQGNKYLSLSDAIKLTRIVRGHNSSLGR